MSAPDLHPLLRRQLRRLGLAEHAAPTDAGWAALLDRVSRAYQEADQDRYLLERSQALASEEMAQLYAALREDRDLLESRVAERTDALRVSEARLASLVSLSSDWIWEQDAELRMAYLSDGFSKATGLEPELLLGRRREEVESFELASSAEAVDEYVARIRARQPFRDFTFGLRHPDGSVRYIRSSGFPVFDAAGGFLGYRGVGTDVTDATVAARQVERLARFDSLTGLLNRAMFIEELERAIRVRPDSPLAVCFLDLDRFKNINDSLGHAAGDELLQVMAQRLRAAVRQSDIVARLGGDEFVVLVDGTSDQATLARITGKILAVVSAPVELCKRSFQVTGSVGVACYPTDGTDAQTLLREADTAMYRAKHRGKNNVAFYTGELAEAVAAQFSLEADLWQALAREELVLHFQPKYDLIEGVLCGMEALARWEHPTRGLVPPGSFIPLAEERGLIVPLGRWVFDAACRQIRAWRDAGFTPPRCAVNLSASQLLSASLSDDLTSALERHGIEPGAIELELTESVLMADPAASNEVLRRLHARGLHIAIDDFGTGYSSLAYLKRVPASALKIDRSFIAGLPGDRDDRTITEAVIALAHSLGLRVVAEGVETPDQLALLRALGCDEAQGYLLGRPQPAERMAEVLQPARG